MTQTDIAKQERKLTPKHQAFADDWLIHRDATKAARNAKYSEKTAAQIGYQLLHHPSVSEYIRKRTETVAEKLGITHEYILGGIKRVIDKTNVDGQKFDPKSALKGHELLGKHLKLFDEDDKKQTNVTINVIQY